VLLSTLAFLGRPWGRAAPVVPVAQSAQFNAGPAAPMAPGGPGSSALATRTAAATPRVPAPNLSDQIDVHDLEVVLPATAKPDRAPPTSSRSRAVWSNASGAVSGGGLTAEYCCAGASSTIVADTPVTRGRHYWEVTLSTGGTRPDTYTNIGVIAGAANNREVLPDPRPGHGSNNSAWLIRWNEWDRYHNGDVVMVALDADMRVVYFGLNGAWLTGDPEQGGGTPIGADGSPLIAAVTVSSSSGRSVRDRWIANFGASAFQYRPPNGYGAYGARGAPVTAVSGDGTSSLPAFESEVVVGGRKVPLPEGRWLELARFKDSRSVREVALLGRAESSRLVEMVAIEASNATSYPRFPGCDRTDYLAVDVSSNEPSAAQRCWWVNHAVGLWRDQTAFRVARDASRSLVMPDAMISVSFHEAGPKGAITVHYYFDPTQRGIDTPLTSWSDSPWHRDRVAADPARKDYIADRVDWGKTWAKIVSAYR